MKRLSECFYLGSYLGGILGGGGDSVHHRVFCSASINTGNSTTYL